MAGLSAVLVLSLVSLASAAAPVQLAVVQFRAIWPGQVPYSKPVQDLFTGCTENTFQLQKLNATVKVALAVSAPVSSAASTVATGGRRLLQTNVGTMTGVAAYNGADVTATVTSATGNASSLQLGSPATQYTDLLSTCTRSKGYEVTFIQLAETINTKAGASALANTTLLPTAGVQAIMQISGTDAVPFNADKQTALLMFLNNALPAVSTGLSALRITAIKQDASKKVANVTLAALIGSNVAEFQAKLATAAGQALNTQMAAAGLSSGYSAKLLSAEAAPQLSIASQIQALGVQLKDGNGGEAAAAASGGSSGPSIGLIVGVAVGAVALLSLLAALIAIFVMRRREKGFIPSPAPSEGSDPHLAAKAAALWGENSSEYSSDAGGKLRGSISDRLANSKFDSQSARTMCRMGRMDDSLLGWAIDPSEISITKRKDGSDWVLGAGTYGKVYKGVRGGTQDVAVKMLHCADAEEGLKQFVDECCILKSLNYDKNVVQFYGACLLSGLTPMLVLEYCEGGDLRSALTRDEEGLLAWDKKGRQIALDIACGLHFLHSHDVMHSDLKTKNILLTRDQATAKIGDVGLAQFMGSAYFKSENVAWTFAYAAPELLLNANCSAKVDIYSFGVVLWEIVTGEVPTRGRLTALTPSFDCPKALCQLVDDCMDPDPARRPTAKECFDRIKVMDGGDLHSDGDDSGPATPRGQAQRAVGNTCTSECSVPDSEFSSMGAGGYSPFADKEFHDALGPDSGYLMPALPRRPSLTASSCSRLSSSSLPRPPVIVEEVTEEPQGPDSV